MSIADGYPGRLVALTWDGSPLGGAREISVTYNGEPLDVSDASSEGWRELLAVSGEISVDITVSGITKSAVLKTDWFAGTRTKTLVVTYPTGGGSFTGSFMLAEFSEGVPYKEASTYEATFQSTGEITYTPPA